MTSQPLRAGLYARISDDREGEGLGVRRQLEDCHKLAALREWTVVDCYTDDSVSAYSGKERPHYKRMLEDVRDGRLDVIVAWHTDRLHRSTRELLDFADTLAKAGARVETVQGGGLDLTTTSGRAVATTLAAWAEHESAHKAERNRRKARQIAEAGGFSGGGTRPFGYQREVQPETRKILREWLHPEEAEVVRDLMARALAGAGSISLASYLNRAGITTPTGGPWRGVVVRRLLTSARIAGWREHHGEFVAEAVWPAIVTREEVERLRAAWRPPKWGGSGLGRGPRRHLLTGGVTVCGRCGSNLLSRPHTNGTPSLVCATTPGAPNCGKIRVQHEPLEALVVDMLLTALASPDLAERLAVSSGPEASDLVAEVRQLEDDLAEIAAMHGRRELSRAEWLAAREPMQADLEHARKALARRTRTVALDGLGDLTADALRRRWDGLDLTARSAVLTAIVERVEIGPAVRGRNRFDPDRVRVVWRA